MNNLPIDLKSLPFLIYLSSKNLLEEYISNSFFVTDERIKDLIFLDQRKYNYSLPNYIHHDHLSFIKQKNINFNLESSFDELSRYFLEINSNNELWIKKEKFEEWQLFISVINPIPIITFYAFKHNINIKRILRDSSILKMNHKSSQIEKFFSKRRAFNELHIHLNGTSEVIFNWQHFLNNPSIIYKKLKYNLHFEQLGFKNLKEIMDLVEVAKYIQENIVYIIKNINTIDINEMESFFKEKKVFNKYNHTHPIQLLSKKYHTYSIPQLESIFWENIIEVLEKEKDSSKLRICLEKLSHIYLLIYTQFNKLLVQQYEQYGFDQFQMITDNGVRDFYEDLGYKDRFNQLKGMDRIKFDIIEGRFAPKKNIYKTYKLLNKAIYDYKDTKLSKPKQRYLQKKKIKDDNQINQLSLTAHFIKKKNTSCILNSNSRYLKFIKCPRHPNLRKELFTQATILVNLIKTHKGKYLNLNTINHNYCNFINGIDAAGNELYARPEVFSPSFKYIRDELKYIDKNIGITFHAGEDFVHIVSGIRYIYEAINFLDMKKRDRIGHATALGISPILWMNKLNNQLLIKKGEWLDNLIFICKKLKLQESKFPEISKYWQEIYDTTFLGLNKTFSAYCLRKIEPDSLFDNKVSYLNLKQIKIKKQILDIYRNYHYSSKVKKEYEKLISISISDYLEFIEPLQKLMLKKLYKKDIAIEVMPSSNTRISFYDKYEQHHIFKWLGKKYIPSLVIATDDPGIFNTNLKNEYSHLYKVLSEKEERSDEYILDIFKTLHNNSQKYVFK